MTYYLLFLICGFFAGIMFEKNRLLSMAVNRFEDFRHMLLHEAIKRKSATILLPSRKNTVAGLLRSIIAMCVMLFLVGCVLPTGSPMGYYTPSVVPTPSPMSFYIPPAAMSFTTGQWQAPDAFTEFKPRTPIPRQASGMIGNQYFTTLY